jgi:hypothetical protein
VDEEAPRLVYNPDDGSVELHIGGRSVTVDGLDAGLQFERMTPDGDAAAPLWLAPNEADVLRKMIGYILDKVRITEESKATLAALLPRVRAIADGEGDADGGDGGGRSSAPDRAPARAERAPAREERDDRPVRSPADVPGVRRGMPRPADDDDDG